MEEWKMKIKRNERMKKKMHKTMKKWNITGLKIEKKNNEKDKEWNIRKEWKSMKKEIRQWTGVKEWKWTEWKIENECKWKMKKNERKGME